MVEKKTEKMKMKINLPFLKLEIEGNPSKHLPELRKIFSELNKVSLNEIEAEALEELMPSFTFPIWKLSREIQKDDKLMTDLSQIAQVEESIVVKKTNIENINEITESGAISRINVNDVKKAISKVFYDIEPEKANFALIHIMGNIDEENFSIIADQTRKYIPNCQVEVLKTKKEILGKTVIELVLFGNFPAEISE